MSCKFLNPDSAVIVRCEFDDNKVCNQYLENERKDNDKNIYHFCEKQSKNYFEPQKITKGE